MKSLLDNIMYLPNFAIFPLFVVAGYYHHDMIKINNEWKIQNLKIDTFVIIIYICNIIFIKINK